MSLTDEALQRGDGLSSVARRLGRTLNATRQARIRHLRTAHKRRLKCKILEFYAKGYATAQIAREVGCKCSTVSYHLSRAGLPPNKDTPEAIAYLAEANRCRYRAACKTMGVENMGQRTAIVLRLEAFLDGWPAGTDYCHARVLNVLRERGPSTMAEIAQALGRVHRRGKTYTYKIVRQCRQRQLVEIHHLKRQGKHGSAPQVVSLHPVLQEKLKRSLAYAAAES